MIGPVGYCTNVHAGQDLTTICRNLAQHAGAVREQLNVDQLPVGLWIPDRVSKQLEQAQALETFSATLRDHALIPYTFNAFPFGDFHQAKVKHDVYQPPWWDPRRADYTIRVAKVLTHLLPPGQRGTISTLPLGWPNPQVGNATLQRAADHLLQVEAALRRLARETGRQICLCLEPEPGCILQTSHDVIDFFQRFLSAAHGRRVDRPADYLGVCHDICHAAVMREAQREMIERYRLAGIRVAKVQISSCIQVNFDDLEAHARTRALQELETFAEDRYLHQTTVAPIRSPSNGPAQDKFFEDLPFALAQARRMGAPFGEWRIHFHVPVYLERFGLLRTSRDAIIECLEALESADLATGADVEIETYAWNVLPRDLQQTTLAHGIARELRWLQDLCQSDSL